MKFKKYSTIENSYQESFIKSIKMQGIANMEFVVQEKVHGANFSFISNGEMMKVAKRTELLFPDEDFYNYQEVQILYKEKVAELIRDLRSTYQFETLTLFGELFGGGYPHEDVSKNLNAKLVQRGVYYAPHNDFYAFDILIDSEGFLNVDLSNALFEKHGFVYAKTLFKGTLIECMDFKNQYQTTIPACFELPEIEGNFCEGNIIRTVQPIRMKNGSRVIIKNKNENWLENNRRIDKTLLAGIYNDGSELSENALFLQTEIVQYITENRLNNLIGKLGAINPQKDFGKILGMFNKDVLNDFVKDYAEKYYQLDKVETKAVNKFLNKHASDLISNIF